MWISNGQNNSAITPDWIPMDDNWIKNEVNAVLTYINTGERSFANLSDGQLEKILLSMSTYLRQIRVSWQNYELFSFLDEFNKLWDSLNISREESILFLQFYSRLWNIPKNLILSDGSHIDTDKIFGWRFGTWYNNRELCNRIQNALENKNQNPGEKLKTLIK